MLLEFSLTDSLGVARVVHVLDDQDVDAGKVNRRSTLGLFLTRREEHLA
jgi:hypothetical protein